MRIDSVQPNGGLQQRSACESGWGHARSRASSITGRPFFRGVAILVFAAALCLPFVSTRKAGASPTRPSAKRVLLISIDGLHALDLANFIKSDPHSNLAQLSVGGLTYTQASTSKPSDSFPGLMSIVTGGSPISTGVWYEGGYARDLSPAGSKCSSTGTEIVWDSGIDRDKKLPDGGGIDAAKLPLDPNKGCTPVYPHSYLRVNTIFEVAHQAKLRTAWVDKHPSYEMVNGPSGKGVDDLFTPELSATKSNKDLRSAEAFDDQKIQAVLNEVNGKDHSGARSTETPNLFGTSLQAVSMGQKLGGYTDELGTPSLPLLETLRHTDESIGKILAALRERGMTNSTLVIVTAKHGESPVDPRKRRLVPDTVMQELIEKAHPGSLALDYQDGDLASIWLKEHGDASAVVATLSQPENEAAMDVEQILSGESLKLMFNDPLKDPRTPDIVVMPQLGGLYLEADTKFLAEHGGFHKQDVNVALLLAGPGVKRGTIKTPVQTTQIAPTILRSLGLDPSGLQAIQREKTRELPD